jgi:hypothetical protein
MVTAGLIADAELDTGDDMALLALYWLTGKQVQS